MDVSFDNHFTLILLFCILLIDRAVNKEWEASFIVFFIIQVHIHCLQVSTTSILIFKDPQQKLLISLPVSFWRLERQILLLWCTVLCSGIKAWNHHTRLPKYFYNVFVRSDRGSILSFSFSLLWTHSPK